MHRRRHGDRGLRGALNLLRGRDIGIGITAFLAAAAGIAAAAHAVEQTRSARPSAPQHAERCGWIHNPTPGNWSLEDRDGPWEIGAQGGYQAAGMDGIPDLTEREWVVTNGSSYGYGCGCLRVAVDAKRRRILRIDAVRQKPLSACRADRRLRRQQ